MPANWDSWGKIRIIREGFDMEGASTAWSIEIQDPPEPLDQSADSAEGEDDGTSAVTVFEQTIKDPKRDTSIAQPTATTRGSKIEVETNDMQFFLADQVDLLEQLRAEDEKERANQQVPQLEMSPMDEGKVNEHIGPVQFNMGGIQVDADDMLKKLRVCATTTIEIITTNIYTGPRSQPRPKKRRTTHSPWRRESSQPSPGQLLRRPRQEARWQSSWKPICLIPQAVF